MDLIDVKALECPACNAPYTPNQERCGFCGSFLPRQEQPQTTQQPDPQLANREIVDYYALLGLNPLHLIAEPLPTPVSTGPFAVDSHAANAVLSQRRPPNELEVREAALQAEQRILFMPGLDQQQRQAQIAQIELAAWILTDERAHKAYDSALLAMRKGTFTEGHFSLLNDLRRRAQEALGMQGEGFDGAELLRQGVGYLSLGMYEDAIAMLRQAIDALPDSAEAHYRYAHALINSEDPLVVGPHKLRQAAASFSTAARLEARLTDAPAYAALCNGLLARQDGNIHQAATDIRKAVTILPRLGVAWRALAALAFQNNDYTSVLTNCRQALLANSRDENAYALLIAACWRMGQKDHARDAAARLATLRGSGWSADRVLHEIVGT